MFAHYKFLLVETDLLMEYCILHSMKPELIALS